MNDNCTIKKSKEFYCAQIEKVAAPHKDVWSTYKEKNTEPFKFRDAFNGRKPENFRGTVRTKIRPITISDDQIGYDVISTGGGRKNQLLEARSMLNDVPKITKKEEADLQEFNDRMNPHYKRLAKNKKNTVKKVLGGMAAGATAGMLTGKDKDTRLTGAILGGAAGIGTGAMANVIGKTRAEKAIIKNLTDKERDTLLKLKEDYGSRHAQKATSAHKLIGRNYYMI